MDKRKLDSISNLPLPKTTRAMREFLGLIGYYRKFIKSYGEITTPLNYMLKKGAFQWDEDAMESFEDLKYVLLTPPILRMPYFEEEFILVCDASWYWSCNHATKHSIAFYNEGLKGRSQSLITYEKEILAILAAIRKWCKYLLGRRFTIRTNQHTSIFSWIKGLDKNPNIHGYRWLVLTILWNIRRDLIMWK